MICYTWDIEELKMIRRSKKYKREALERAAIEYLQNPRFGYRYYADLHNVNIGTLYSHIMKQNERERKNNAKT